MSCVRFMSVCGTVVLVKCVSSFYKTHHMMQSKKKKAPAQSRIHSTCNYANTFFFFYPCSFLVHIHTHTPQHSVRASPQVLCYSVKQLEWAQKSLDFLFTFNFPRLTGTGATKPDSCEGFGPLCQDWDFCRAGREGKTVLTGKARCCLSF